MNQTLVLKFLRMLQLVPDLTPEGTPVNLDKFHYSVTERDITDIITTDDFSFCDSVGFSHSIILGKNNQTIM